MNDLKHHGVMGMKWGVRRYQNKDGSLTPKGKARLYKIDHDERLQKKETKRATKMLTRIMKENNKKASKFMSAYYKQSAKGNVEKANRYREIGEMWFKTAMASKQKLSDISSGTIKAGRDFMMQIDYNVWIYPRGIVVTTEQRMIETKRR